MSIRQYRPRDRNRRGLSSKQFLILTSLIVLSIFLQILYPLVHGGLLRATTIAFIYSGAAAMLFHALFSYGPKYLFLYFAITFLFSLGLEEIGSRTGWPFGTYQYSSSLGIQIFKVPLVVPFAWLMMAHPILVISRKITQHWVFLVGGAGLMIWDLFVDPLMVASGRWTWNFDGAHVPLEPSIPLSNCAGWLLGGMALIAILHQVLPKERRKVGASRTAVDLFLLWTVFSGSVGNIFFFDTPGVALIGGIPFTILLFAYFFKSRLGRPDQF